MAGPTHSRQSVEGLASHVEQIIARQPPPPPAAPSTPAGGFWGGLKRSPADETRRTNPTTPATRRPIPPITSVDRSWTPLTSVPPAIPEVVVPPRKSLRYWIILSLAVAFILAAIYAAAVAWFPPPWWALRIPAHVTRVVDGDTIAVQTPGFAPKTIRLAQIDAPERRQPGGAASHNALKMLVMGRDVDVYVTGKDRYGRLIAQIRLNGQDVARDMTRNGYAWAYRAYLSDPVMPLLEWRAWLLGSGIWQDSRFGQQAPWDYRAERRRKAAALVAERKARAKH